MGKARKRRTKKENDTELRRQQKRYERTTNSIAGYIRELVLNERFVNGDERKKNSKGMVCRIGFICFLVGIGMMIIVAASKLDHTYFFWKIASTTSQQEEKGTKELNREIEPVIQSGPGYDILAVVSHDPAAFTQGFSFHDGWIYESTGLWGESSLRQVNPVSGEVERSTFLNDIVPKTQKQVYFGEGLCLLSVADHNSSRQLQRTKALLLTWKKQIAFIIDLQTFAYEKTFSFTTMTKQGWGVACSSLSQLTMDNIHLAPDVDFNLVVVSDGSSFLHVWDVSEVLQSSDSSSVPAVKEFQRVEVVHKTTRAPVKRLNELEFIRATVKSSAEIESKTTRLVVEYELLANVWYSYKVPRITFEVIYYLKDAAIDTTVRKDTTPGDERRRVAVIKEISAEAEMIGFLDLDHEHLPFDKSPEEDVLNGIAHDSKEDVLYFTGKNWERMFKLKLK